MSEPDQGAAPASLFIVERRLPKAGEHQLAVAQAALTGAAARFSARGDGVRYLRPGAARSGALGDEYRFGAAARRSWAHEFDSADRDDRA